MKSVMIPGTPWEEYDIESADGTVTIHVKREDLCCLPPGPQYSKLRGEELFLATLPKGTIVGVQDAGHHSRSGWGTAFLCKRFGLECHVFYPVYKAEGSPEPGGHPIREFQAKAQEMGATLHGVRAGRASVIWHQSRRIIEELSGGEGVMLPAGLKLRENAQGTSIEARMHTPSELRCGTWVGAISTGTTFAGVIMGLEDWQADIDFICYFGSSKNEEKTREYMIDVAGYEPDHLEFIDEGWNYSDAEERPVPFPCSKWYEAKAWHWIAENVDDLYDPICFWNIGD